MKVIIGSRESVLAVTQSRLIIDEIKRGNESIEVELLTMKTTGDIILDKTLDKIGGKGLFVKELDRALKDKVVDITVHSFKDMPMEVDEDIPIVAVSQREDPRDALVLPIDNSSGEIDLSKPIGCASARRTVQLKQLFPGCTVKPIRGNVQTRLSKLDSGEFSATVLAVAGLNRLGLQDRISRVFSPDEMLPAACQGIMAVQARNDLDRSILAGVNDNDAMDVSSAERAFVTKLNGGCSSPIAAYATVNDTELCLTGMYVTEAGEIIKATISGKREDATRLGEQLALEIRNSEY